MNQVLPIKAKIIRPNVCANCKHSHKNEADQTECRESPPKAAVFLMPPKSPASPPGFMAHTSYPLVNGDMWCGAWQTKIEIT